MHQSHWPQSIKAILILSGLVFVLFFLPLFWLMGSHEGLAKELHRPAEALSWDIHFPSGDTLVYGPPTIHFWTRSIDDDITQLLATELYQLRYERSQESITNPRPHEQRWTRSDAAVELYEEEPIEASRGLACGDTVIAFYPSEASCWVIRFHASD